MKEWEILVVVVVVVVLTFSNCVPVGHQICHHLAAAAAVAGTHTPEGKRLRMVKESTLWLPSLWEEHRTHRRDSTTRRI